MTPNTDQKTSKEGFRPSLAGASILLVTGPSGSGKSTLCAALEAQGWQRLDGDVLARGLYVPGSPLMRDLKRVFGEQVLLADGSLNRVRLGEIVFLSLAQRKKLNALVYPRFWRVVKARLAAARRSKRRLVADVAVYFDAGAPDLKVPVLLLDAPLELRLRRLRARGLPPARARAQAKALTFGPAARRASSAVLDGAQAPAALRKQLFALLRPTAD